MVWALNLPGNHSFWTNPTHHLGISNLGITNRGTGLCNAFSSGLQVSRLLLKKSLITAGEGNFLHSTSRQQILEGFS